jgi:hypothetical protein
MTEVILRKYTSLLVLKKILKDKKITLRDPVNWEDKNDVEVIKKFKNEYQFLTVLATCFAKAEETYLMWKSYAGNESGVCIEFNQEELLTKIPNHEFSSDEVKYTQINELSDNIIEKDKLPFIKRYPYKGENEFRIVFASKEQLLSNIDFSISPSCIKRVLFNPWISTGIYNNLKKEILGISGWKNLNIIQSTVLSNNKWKEKVSNLKCK